MKAVAQPSISMGTIRQIPIALPTRGEQIQIVEHLDALLSTADNLEEELRVESRRCEALRQSILKQAFSGQLVAQDPADEPASMLLERIRAERKKADTKNQGRKIKSTGNNKTGKRATA